jgi:hypothetical protein
MIVKLEKDRIHQQYILKNGQEVVGATTALSIVAKPALIGWAWKLGKAGKDYRRVKGTAADIGTLAHFLCECYLKGDEPDTSEFSPNDLSKAEIAKDKFVKWWTDSGFELVASEAQMVSEAHGFGGTIDIVAKDKQGVLHLCDLKTSGGVWEEYWAQVAAYRELWNEDFNRPQITGETYIVRIGKEADEDDFETPSRMDLTDEFDFFLKALALYNADQKLKSKKQRSK